MLNFYTAVIYKYFATIILVLIGATSISNATITTDTATNFITASSDTLEWHKPRFEQRQNDRHNLVKSLSSRITSEQVRAAMRHVPRHLFVPEQYQAYAYQNRPLPIGHNQTISQPFIVAYMTQLLNLQAGEKVLEIGTGSGYQAAILSELTPEVYSIEIVEALGEQARQRFDKLGYETIETKIGDGYKGWKENAPFDAIVLTAAPPEIPQPLINQLKPGGVLVAPVGSTQGRQVITKLTKGPDGEINREQMLPVRFVPMTGEAQKSDS